MKRVLLLFSLLLIVTAMGCAPKTSYMSPAPLPATPLEESQSAIVFFRPDLLGAAVQAPVVEAKESHVEFIGILS